MSTSGTDGSTGTGGQTGISGSQRRGAAGGTGGQPNLTLLKSEISAATPQYLNGEKVYRISGRYEYVFAAQTIGPGDILDLGAIPWTTDAPGSNVIDTGDYETGIVDPV